MTANLTFFGCTASSGGSSSAVDVEDRVVFVVEATENFEVIVFDLDLVEDLEWWILKREEMLERETPESTLALFLDVDSGSGPGSLWKT